MSPILFEIPPDVVAAIVLPMLNCIDMANLDSAACSYDSRPKLNRIFACTSAFNIRGPGNSNRYARVPAVWNWFWNRFIAIKGAEIHRDGIEDVELNILLVEAPLTLHVGRDYFDSSDGFVGNLATFVGVIEKLNGIRLIGFVDWEKLHSLSALIPHCSNLASFEIRCIPLNVKAVLPLLYQLERPQALRVNVDIDVSELMEAILPMGPTLQSLAIHPVNWKEEHYKLIAQYCPHLTCLSIEQTYAAEESDVGSGSAVIAKNYHRLQEVQIFCNDRSDALLLLFANHCPQLRKMNLPNSTITDIALDTLSCRCFYLKDITATWTVQTVETVQNAAPWLAALRRISWRTKDKGYDLLVTKSTTLLWAMRYLRDQEVLFVEVGMTVQMELTVLQCTRLIKFSWLALEYSDHTADFVTAIARNNHRLEHIGFFGHDWLSNEVMEAISESCPKLRSLKDFNKFLHKSDGRLTDCAVVNLARSCPKLRVLEGCSGLGITDISVLALVEHCRYLEEVDLYYATQVTEAALLKLVEHPLKVLSFNADAYPPEVNKRIQQLLEET